MTREIKFRAWNKKYKIMSGSFSFSYFDGECLCNFDAIPNDKLWYLEDMEVMQYTGLKDKKGKEIYEGDIIRTVQCSCGKENCDKFTPETLLVKWNGVGFTPFCEITESENHIDNGNKEVVGNIYENPELLTNQDK